VYECKFQKDHFDDGPSPLELLSKATSSPNLKQFQTIFCPVYKHHPTLASGNSLPRWHLRSKLGINLGKSPRHARNTYLVLDLVTGLVSPQFHCFFDNFFESVTEAKSNFINIDEWQFKAKFKKGGHKIIVHRNKMVEEDENDDNGHQSEPSYAEVIQQPYTSI